MRSMIPWSMKRWMLGDGLIQGIGKDAPRATNVGPRKMGNPYLLGQWLNFKLFGITYLVGKIKFKLFFPGSIG